MDNSDLTVAVARLSIRLSRLVEFAALIFLLFVDLVAMVVVGAAIHWASLYFLGSGHWQILALGEFTLLIALWMGNRRMRKKVIAHFFKS